MSKNGTSTMTIVDEVCVRCGSAGRCFNTAHGPQCLECLVGLGRSLPAINTAVERMIVLVAPYPCEARRPSASISGSAPTIFLDDSDPVVEATYRPFGSAGRTSGCSPPFFDEKRKTSAMALSKTAGVTCDDNTRAGSSTEDASGHGGPIVEGQDIVATAAVVVVAIVGIALVIGAVCLV